MLSALLLLACSPRAPASLSPGDTAAGGAGVLVLAGGGSEGEADDPSAWSSRLYPHLLDGGDVTGDGRVRVAVVSMGEESGWMPAAFERFGADEAQNLRLDSRAAAEAPDLLAGFDAVFIKGGDQSAYYDAWAGTPFVEAVRALHAGGGGVGGTSAGAMSLAGLAWVADRDLVSLDVLADCDTRYLTDSDGAQGLRDDFLGLLPGLIVDTHLTERGRLGRMAGLLGAGRAEGHAVGALGLGERTGAWIADGVGTVVGEGAAVLLRAEGDWSCAPGAPPAWQGLRLDRLTDGWSWALDDGVVRPAADAEEVAAAEQPDGAPAGWTASGDAPDHAARFAWVAAHDPFPYAVAEGSDAPLLPRAFGFLDAHDEERRGSVEETAFRAVHDRSGSAAILVARGADLSAQEGGGVAAGDGEAAAAPAAALVIDGAAITVRGLAPGPAPSDLGDGSLRAAALVGARLHLLFTATDGGTWDPIVPAGR